MSMDAKRTDLAPNPFVTMWPYDVVELLDTVSYIFMNKDIAYFHA